MKVTCPKCKNQYKIRFQDVEKRLECENCGTVFVRHPGPITDLVNFSVFVGGLIRRWYTLIILIAAFVAWLITGFSGDQYIGYYSYPALFIAVACGSRMVYRKFPSKALIPIMLIAVFAIPWAWGKVHTYKYEYVNNTHYVITTHEFWSGKPIYGESYEYEKGTDLKQVPEYPMAGGKIRVHAEGPMPKTHEMHGKWTFRWPGTLESETVFYWYGEEVSEGDWHLYNNKYKH